MPQSTAIRPTRQCAAISFGFLFSLFLVASLYHPGLRAVVLKESQIISSDNLPTCSRDDMACVPKARYLSPKVLMDRPLPPVNPTNGSIPKLIHQSWSSNTLPAKFITWSDTWRANHPDWEWVLWTDDDNRALVDKYFPWFKEPYMRLKGEIFRADAARNMYMYAFGGIYADLDVECLRPFDRMFSSHLSDALRDSTPPKGRIPSLYQTAFFGRMGTDESFLSSIPNAWMASTPFHPFFLLPLEYISQQINDSVKSSWAEGLTGPAALRGQILRYQSSKTDIVEYLKTTAMNHTYFGSYDLQHSITLLAPEVIFPFAWNMPWGDPRQKYCHMSARIGEGFFDKERCKDELRVRENGGYCITYWSHTWTTEGHNEENLAVASKDTKRDVN